MEAAYVQYQPLLLYVATRKFRVPAEDCEALVQEAVLSFLMVDCSVENPKAWLVGAVCNACRHYWRARARTNEVEGVRIDDLTDSASETDVPRLEQQILIRRVLSGLLPADREILRLHYFEGQTATEIAATLDSTRRYAEKLIVRALSRARRRYEHLQEMPATPVRMRVTRKSDAINLKRLAGYLKKHGITIDALQAESGLLEPQMNSILCGHNVGVGAKVRITKALRRLTSEAVPMDELFAEATSDGVG